MQITGVKQFVLGEGLDNTGVNTKVLTCNCSVDMAIENHSKVFGLHIRPPAMEMAFGRLVLAKTQVDIYPAMSILTSLPLLFMISFRDHPIIAGHPSKPRAPSSLAVLYSSGTPCVGNHSSLTGGPLGNVLPCVGWRSIRWEQ